MPPRAKLREEVNGAKEDSDYTDEEIEAALVKAEAACEHYWIVRIYTHELGHHLGYEPPEVEDGLRKRFVRDVDLTEVLFMSLEGPVWRRLVCPGS